MRKTAMTAIGALALALPLATAGVASAAEARGPERTQAAQAPAAVSSFTCVSGYFCAWTGAGGTGDKVRWSGNDADWSSRIDNKGTSFYNNGNPSDPSGLSSVRVYTDPNYTGRRLWCLAPGGRISKATPNEPGNPGNDNKASSHKWTAGC